MKGGKEGGRRKEGRIEAVGNDEQLCKKSKYYKDMLAKSNAG